MECRAPGIVEREEAVQASEIKIDLKLPEASTALAGVPRRKEFVAGEEGRKEWKAAFNSYAGDFAYSHVGAETLKGRIRAGWACGETTASARHSLELRDGEALGREPIPHDVPDLSSLQAIIFNHGYMGFDMGIPR